MVIKKTEKKMKNAFPFLLLIVLIFYSSNLSAQTIKIFVLGVPGYDTLIRELQVNGYNASLYGPVGRPANQFQVISIGEQVPANIALNVLKIAKRIIPSLEYVFVRSDLKNVANGPLEITIGATNDILQEYPNIKPFFGVKFLKSIEHKLEYSDFQKLVSENYKETSKQDNNSYSSNAYIRKDGVIVVPNPDGTASLFGPNGRKGSMGKDGHEMWLFENLVQKIPVQPSGSADTQWLDGLNNWLNSIGNEMMNNIELILNNSTSFENYKSLEKQSCNSLYEQINLREEYLKIIVDKNFKQNN